MQHHLVTCEVLASPISALGIGTCPSLPLAPLAGRGRVRGHFRQSELVERPPHPDPLHSPSNGSGLWPARWPAPPGGKGVAGAREAPRGSPGAAGAARHDRPAPCFPLSRPTARPRPPILPPPA